MAQEGMSSLQNSSKPDAVDARDGDAPGEAQPEASGAPTLAVGARIRELRQLRRHTLRVVADRTGLTESFLSQVERGRANASLASLHRITTALGVDIAHLFDQSWDSQPKVLRKQDRHAIEVGQLCRKTLLTPWPFRHLEVLGGEIAEGGSSGDEQHTHGDSEELFLVLSGTVHLHLADKVFEMGAGDCIDYQASVPHRVVNAGPGPAEVMWIVSPPSAERAT